jgi:hypothetical protein
MIGSCRHKYPRSGPGRPAMELSLTTGPGRNWAATERTVICPESPGTATRGDFSAGQRLRIAGPHWPGYGRAR